MNIQYALSSITADSTTQNAAKYQSWGGYFHKTTEGLSSSDISDGKYKLIFVQRDGDQFVFTFDGSGGFVYNGFIAHTSTSTKGTGTPVSATPLPLDEDILKAIAGDNWILGSLTDFETARNGNGEW